MEIKQNIGEFIRTNWLIVLLTGMLVVLVGNALYIYRMQKTLLELDQTKSILFSAESDLLQFDEQIVAVKETVLRGLEHGQAHESVSFYKIHKQTGELGSQISQLLAKSGCDQTKSAFFEKAAQDFLTSAMELFEVIGLEDNDVVANKLEMRYERFQIFYDGFRDTFKPYKEEILANSNEQFKNSLKWPVIFNSIILLFAFPALLVVIRKVRADHKRRNVLFQQLDDSNKNLIFNSGVELNGLMTEEHAINELTSNLQKSKAFVSNLAEGKYDVSWENISKENEKLNQHNLVGELLRMRNKLIEVRKQDQHRIWQTEGVSMFSEIIRNHKGETSTLAEKILVDLVKYVDARQGAFFVVEDEDKGGHLELIGLYAYDRMKMVKKRIAPGEGAVGQCLLEGETIFLKKVPEEYTSIASGLGDVPPSSVVVVPLKSEGKIEGVLELASLDVFTKEHIELLERIGELIASTLVTAKITEQTQKLLAESQMQAEEMRAQEEEMRQNVEELQATQESASRREREMRSIVDALDSSFLVAELDRGGNITRINEPLADIFNKSTSALTGMSWKDLIVCENYSSDQFEALWQSVSEGNFVRQEILVADLQGTFNWLAETYTPIQDGRGKLNKILIISVNITESKEKEERVRVLLSEAQEKNEALKIWEDELMENLNELEETRNKLSTEQSYMNSFLLDIPDAVYFKDTEGRYLKVSQAMTNLFGVDNPLKIIGKSVYDFQSKEHGDAATAQEKEILEGKKSVINTVESLKMPDGTEQWVSTTKLALKDDAGQIIGTFGMSRNITDLKLKELELQKTVDELEKKLKNTK